MNRKFVVAVVLALVPVARTAFAQSTGFWEVDYAYVGKVNPRVLDHATPGDTVPGYWWRDTTNQNALASFMNTSVQGLPAGLLQPVPDAGVWFYKPSGTMIPPVGEQPQAEPTPQVPVTDYGTLGNLVIIEATNSTILVGTGGSAYQVQSAKAWANIHLPGKPIRWMIVTDADTSAWGGWESAYTSDPPQPLNLLTSATLPSVLQHQAALSPTGSRLSAVSGTGLPADTDWRMGVGNAWLPGYGTVPPTCPSPSRPLLSCVLITGAQTLNLDGVQVVFRQEVAAIGGMTVYLPAQKILIPPTLFGRYLPNTAPLTGPAIPSSQVIKALDDMLSTDVEAYLPLHTGYISPKSDVTLALTEQHDILTYLSTETANRINQGMSVDDIAAQVQLPSVLAPSAYAQEYVNTIASTVRGIYDEYLGWFDGKASSLSPLSELDKARVIVDLAGGPTRLLQLAREAEYHAVDQASVDKGLYLVEPLRLVAPSADADLVYFQLLLKAAYLQKSAHLRNYYLSLAWKVRPLG